MLVEVPVVVVAVDGVGDRIGVCALHSYVCNLMNKLKISS